MAKAKVLKGEKAPHARHWVSTKLTAPLIHLACFDGGNVCNYKVMKARLALSACDLDITKY